MNERRWYKLPNKLLFFNFFTRLRSASSVVLQEKFAGSISKVDNEICWQVEKSRCQTRRIIARISLLYLCWTATERVCLSRRRVYARMADRKSTDIIEIGARYDGLTTALFYYEQIPYNETLLKWNWNISLLLYELRKNFPSFCVPCWLYNPRLFCILTSETTKSDASSTEMMAKRRWGASDWRN